MSASGLQFAQAHQAPVYWTRLEGTEIHVGELDRFESDDDDDDEMRTRHRRTKPYIFLSHTGRDDVKEEIARPTHWFLTEILKVDAFLDDHTMEPGTGKNKALADAANRCTHALVVLSPTYRSRKYCVAELNTFMRRYHDQDVIIVMPALWLLPSADGYSSSLNDLTWLKSRTKDAADFMVKQLWPQLYKRMRTTNCRISSAGTFLGFGARNPFQFHWSSSLNETKGQTP